MGGVLAEKLQLAGLQVSLVTSAGLVSQWCENTVEQQRVQGRLLNLGVRILTGKVVNRFDGDQAEIACAYTGALFVQPAASLVTVTARISHDELYRELIANPEGLADSGIVQVHRIGDCRAPGIIAAAVYSGHKLARELDDPQAGYMSFKRERCAV
jgi:dimethylamine/trimethylamine dehydrogenase